MVPDNPEAGNLYGVVKDHKQPRPKLWEVVSGSGSNTEYISEYMDHHSKPKPQNLASYVEDTPYHHQLSLSLWMLLLCTHQFLMRKA